MTAQPLEVFLLDAAATIAVILAQFRTDTPTAEHAESVSLCVY